MSCRIRTDGPFVARELNGRQRLLTEKPTPFNVDGKFPKTKVPNW